MQNAFVESFNSYLRDECLTSMCSCRSMMRDGRPKPGATIIVRCGRSSLSNPTPDEFNRASISHEWTGTNLRLISRTR
jgi:hypothetical protein